MERKNKINFLTTLEIGEKSKKKYNTISVNRRSTIKIVEKGGEKSNRDL